MSDNGHAGWICKRCEKDQTEPKSHKKIIYCASCKPLARKEQTSAWQKANLAQFRNARPDLAEERRKGR